MIRTRGEVGSPPEPDAGTGVGTGRAGGVEALAPGAVVSMVEGVALEVKERAR